MPNNHVVRHTCVTNITAHFKVGKHPLLFLEIASEIIVDAIYNTFTVSLLTADLFLPDIDRVSVFFCFSALKKLIVTPFQKSKILFAATT